MSASTVEEEEDIEEESAVTRVISDQHLDQLLNGELLLTVDRVDCVNCFDCVDY